MDRNIIGTYSDMTQRSMGNYSSEVDCPSLDLPITKPRRVCATASADLWWHMLSLLLPASLLRFGECPFRSRAQFARFLLRAVFGFTIF